MYEPVSSKNYSRSLGETSSYRPLEDSSVPLWGQTTWNFSGLSPKRDCSTRRVCFFVAVLAVVVEVAVVAAVVVLVIVARATAGDAVICWPWRCRGGRVVLLLLLLLLLLLVLVLLLLLLLLFAWCRRCCCPWGCPCRRC